MPYPFPSDVRQMVEARLASGRYASEDDVLRDALRALAEEEEDLVAVREAIQEWRAGDEGVPLAEAFDRVHSADPPCETTVSDHLRIRASLAGRKVLS